MSSVSVPASFMEEFFNKNHSKSDGKFASGSGGRAVPGVRSDGTPVSDVRHYPGSTPFSKRASDGVQHGKSTGKTVPAVAKAAPAHGFRSVGRKVLDANGKHVGTWDALKGSIAIKGGQRSTLNAIKGVRDKATSINSDVVSGRTKQETFQNLAKRLADHAADVRVTGTVSDVFSNTVKGSKREQSISVGAIKVSHVSVGKDGAVKLKGKSSDYKVVKGVDSHYRTKYQVEGIYVSNNRLRSFSTQAAAKMAIVRQIKEVQKANPVMSSASAPAKTPTKLSPAPPYTLTTTKKVATLPTSLQRRIAKIAPGIAAAIKAEDTAKRK